jgi:glycolate dehydrogenase FAD-binding subunit
VTAHLVPTTFEHAAAALREASRGEQAARLLGGGTKTAWVSRGIDPSVEISSRGLDRVVEHNAGDLTAVLEAGVPLAEAQERFASAGQMLALDPPLGEGQRATIGGIVATADSGPMRHRYGGVRDLVIGMTVALSDGTLSRSGGKVIKNVAGYDIAKLFCGSFGTLGMILSVNIRLHPAPPAQATALGSTDDPAVLTAAAIKLAAAPLELDALDVHWRRGQGELLARVAGADPDKRAERAAALMTNIGLGQTQVAHEDEHLWARQRAGQRSRSDALVRVAARPSKLAELLVAADACDGGLVGRAGLGTCYIECDPDAVMHVSRSVPQGASAVVLDGPEVLTRWEGHEGPAVELMRRVKQRFDPAGTCNPGTFVGGI